MLAESGCSVPKTASIAGHSLASATRILETYLSATRALATSAIAKRELRMASTAEKPTFLETGKRRKMTRKMEMRQRRA